MSVMDAMGKVVEETRIPSMREDVRAARSPHHGGRVVVEACMAWEWAYESRKLVSMPCYHIRGLVPRAGLADNSSANSVWGAGPSDSGWRVLRGGR